MLGSIVQLAWQLHSQIEKRIVYELATTIKTIAEVCIFYVFAKYITEYLTSKCDSRVFFREAVITWKHICYVGAKKNISALTYADSILVWDQICISRINQHYFILMCFCYVCVVVNEAQFGRLKYILYLIANFKWLAHRLM